MKDCMAKDGVRVMALAAMASLEGKEYITRLANHHSMKYA
jgi:hypothetical protein